jgi:DNA-binding MarR family transcriptional regulator
MAGLQPQGSGTSRPGARVGYTLRVVNGSARGVTAGTEPGAAVLARPDDVADQILEVVPRLMRRIRREMRAEAGPRGSGGTSLSIPQFRILVRVGRVPGLSLKTLADDLGMSPSAASTLVDRLVRSGELERIVDPDERRRIQLFLSPSGRARMRRARRLAQMWLSETLAELASEELRGLATGLGALGRIGEAGT